MKPSAWVNALLDRHDLPTPDGRPLYQYRVTDEEFEALSQSLKLSAFFGVQNAGNILLWDAALVFYGAEWWRRYYQGHWGWEGIFESLGMDYRELSTQQRNALVIQGLQRWRREVKVINGSRRMLGTVATEGGLPLNQLRESGGWLERVMKTVLQRHLSRGFAIGRLLEGFREYIPQSFQCDEALNILEDMLATVVALRSEYQLAEQQEPVAWLDRQRPHWRDDFPLPINDEVGLSLLTGLIQTASSAREQPANSTPFEMVRQLTSPELPMAALIAEMDVPQFLDPDAFELTSAQRQRLLQANSIELVCVDGLGQARPWSRGIRTVLNQRPMFRLMGNKLRWQGEQAEQECRVFVRTQGQEVAELAVLGGSKLNRSEPWLFRWQDNQCHLAGTASHAIKDTEGLVYIPSLLAIHPEQDATITPMAPFAEGRLYRLQGTTLVTTAEERYRLSTGKRDSLDWYQLTGNRYPYASVPYEIYIGYPKVKRVNALTGSSSATGLSGARPVAKPIGQTVAWQPLERVPPGCYEVRVQDADDNILMRKRIGILDGSLSITLLPDRQKVNHGLIKLDGLKGVEISVDREGGVQLKTAVDGDGIALDVTALGAMPPRCINARVLFKHHQLDMMLQLPFPCGGALLFNPQDEVQSPGQALFLFQLWGYRVRLFSGHEVSQATVTLSLQDPSNPSVGKELYLTWPLVLSASGSEFAINDWRDDINDLLRVSTSLDAAVKITFELNRQTVLTLMVKQYDSELTPDKVTGRLCLNGAAIAYHTTEELSQLTLFPMLLTQPEQNEGALPPFTSEQVVFGEWLFMPEKRCPGPWLIYPSPDADIHVRPLLWCIPAETRLDLEGRAVTSLAQAVAIADLHQREQAIGQVLSSMARDFNHKGWHYLNHLWRKTSHLPMATFDIWRVAVSIPVFMASLLLHGRQDILDKLNNELPILWESISLHDWKSAFDGLQTHYQTIMQDDPELNSFIVNKRISEIEQLSASTSIVAHILKNELLKQQTDELLAFQRMPEAFAQAALESYHQQLLRRDDLPWPRMLEHVIRAAAGQLPQAALSCLKIHHNHQTSTILLPAVLAWQSVTGSRDLGGTPAELFNIKRIKNFDTEWFSQSFNVFCAWFYCNNNKG